MRASDGGVGAEQDTRIEAGIEWYPIPGREHEEDCQCARCGSSCGWLDCWDCGGTGEIVDERDWTLGGLIDASEPCRNCEGYGGWHYCLSGRDWCEGHPLPGREGITSTARECNARDD